jgi:hypothetical protein
MSNSSSLCQLQGSPDVPRFGRLRNELHDDDAILFTQKKTDPVQGTKKYLLSSLTVEQEQKEKVASSGKWFSRFVRRASCDLESLQALDLSLLVMTTTGYL